MSADKVAASGPDEVLASVFGTQRNGCSPKLEFKMLDGKMHQPILSRHQHPLQLAADQVLLAHLPHQSGQDRAVGSGAALRPRSEIPHFYLRNLARIDHKKQPSSLTTTKLATAAQNLLCHSGLMGWGLCCLVATKGVPDAKVVAALAATGFKNVDLPLNPYNSGT